MTALSPDRPPAATPEKPGTRANPFTRRRLVFVAVAVVLVVVAVVVIVSVVSVKRAPSVSTLSDAQPGQWSSVALPVPAQNADGSGYELFVKPGTGAGAAAGDLIVFFGDGGLNWNAQTTLEPITNQPGLLGGGGDFYYDSVPDRVPGDFGGMLRTDADAPFAAATIVYIPTTTGDLGVGDGQSVALTSPDQTRATADFNGYNNSRTALDWVYDNLRDPRTVVVSGAGTGGLNAAFWLGDVGLHYDSARLLQYSDSSFVTAARLGETIDPLWRSQFAERFGFEAGNDPLRAAVTHNQQLFAGRLTTLISQTLLDRTLAGYSAGIDGGYYSPQAGADWNYAMKSTMRALQAPDVGAYVYLTDTGADSHGETRHIISTVDAFSLDRQDGVTAEQWLTEAVQNGHPESVGAEFLKQ